MESCLVNALVKAVDDGKRAENGFKKDAWMDVQKALQKEIPDLSIAISQIKSKDAELKKMFWEFQNCRDNSGFGWDQDKQIPTAPDHVWVEYRAVNFFLFFLIFFMNFLSYIHI